MYLLRLAFRPWRMAPLSQIFSSLAVGLLLLVSGFMLWLHRGLDPVLARLGSEQVITAYLDPSVEPESQEKLVDSVRIALGAAPAREIRLVRPDELLDSFKRHYPELARELESLGPEANSIVPRSVSVIGAFDDSVLERIKALPGIESADTSKQRNRAAVSAFTALKWVLNFLLAGLGVALLTGLIHLARSNAYLHRDSLSLLRLWGAGEWVLRAPGMISALIPGLLGGVVATLAWSGFGGRLILAVREISPSLQELPSTGLQFPWMLLAAGVGFGALSGALSAWASGWASRERS